jgi:indole-3-glycerol phosphate synthase
MKAGMMNLAESIVRAKARGEAPIIAEIKRVIPKLESEEGRPRDERNAASLACMYQEGGAIGISLVTETKHFGGQPEKDIPDVLKKTPLPLLIKDFILDEEKVDLYSDLVSRVGKNHLGRTTLLLTTHWLGSRLPAMLDYIHTRGMLALVETRTPDDLSYLDTSITSPRLVGINNKTIDELEKGEDAIRITPELVRQYRRLIGDGLLISQSAHHRLEDVRYSIETGADAVLVGTAFMVSEEPVLTVSRFVHALENGK